MISRRTFSLGLAGATVPLVAGLGVARADAPPAAAPAPAPADSKVAFTAYAMPTKYHPIAALGNWPLDHTCVSTATGMEWGCFGRRYSDDPNNAAPIAKGIGDDLWAKAIGGPDGHALIDYGVNGVCDQCSNRLLIPAGIDVRNSPGNEVATLLSGVYGVGTKELVQRVKDAAAEVNREHPGRITEEEVARAVHRVDGGLDSEWDIVRGHIQQIIVPAVGGPEKYKAIQPEIDDVYLSIYYKRQAMAGAYARGSIDKKTLVARVTQAFVIGLEDMKDIMGEVAFKRIVPMPPQVAAEYVFHQKD